MSTYVPSPWQVVRDQVERYEATDGAEAGLDPTYHRYPVVIVSHRGRRSGAIRKTPLIRVLHDDVYVLVGSLGGAPRDPQWVGNVLANPAITVRDRDVVFEATARPVTPQERPGVWGSAVRAFAYYAQYQENSERVFPLFLCEPRRDGS